MGIEAKSPTQKLPASPCQRSADPACLSKKEAGGLINNL
jgi:hypothetical protein